jgi:hypothetical protein
MPLSPSAARRGVALVVWPVWRRSASTERPKILVKKVITTWSLTRRRATNNQGLVSGQIVQARNEMLTGIGEIVEVLGETHIGGAVEIGRIVEALCGKTLIATGTVATRMITDGVTVMRTDIGTRAAGSGSSGESNAGHSQLIMMERAL